MTNLKKVLVLVVAFAMMLTFGVSAASFQDVDPNASYAEAVSILSSLGLMIGDDQGNFNPDKTITRAEAATIIVRAKGLEDAAAGAKGATQFTDVPASHWASGYINLATQNGIIVGYGDGTFGPEDDVTYEQMVKMIVAALGYTPMADKQGGYPTGYLVIASQKGIAKGTTGTAGEPAPRATVARLLYNSLTVNMMEQTVYSAGAEEYGEVDKTLLYDFLNIDMYEGVITASYATASNVSADDKSITINFSKYNGENYDISKSFIQAEEGDTHAAAYLGYFVVAYAAEDEQTDDYTLLAVAPKANRNEIVEIDYSQIEEVVYENIDIIRVDYLAKATDRSATKLAISDTASFFYNGKNDVSNSKEFLDDVLENKAVGKVKFVDYNNDSEFDFVFVTEYTKDQVVGEIDQARQRLVDKDGNNIKIDLDDEDVIYTFYKADGTPASFEDIEVDNVLTFAESSDGTLVAVYISDKIVEGTVNESRDEVKGGTIVEQYFTIDGEEYRLSKTTASGISVDISDSGKFYLNVDNRIVLKEATKATSDKYAYLYAAGIKEGLGRNTVQIQCLKANGEWEIFDLAESVTVYKDVTTADGIEYKGSTIKSAEEGADLGLYTVTKDDDKLKVSYDRQLFQYETNSSGQINRLYTVTSIKGNDRGPSVDASVKDKAYNANTVRLGSSYLQEDIIVFNVPDQDTDITDEKQFTVSTVKSTFKESSSGYTADLYDIDDYPAIIVAYGAKADLDESTRLLVIERVTESTKNGTSVKRFYGYQEGEAVEAFASEDGVEVIVEDYLDSNNYDIDDIKAGDVVIFSLDIYGDIDKIKVLMTADHARQIRDDQENALNYTFAEGDEDEAMNYFGWAKAKASNNRLTVDHASGEDTIMFRGSYAVYNININRSTPIISVSDYGSIETGEDRAGRNVDYVFVRTYEDNVVDAVVYTFTLEA